MREHCLVDYDKKFMGTFSFHRKFYKEICIIFSFPKTKFFIQNVKKNYFITFFQLHRLIVETAISRFYSRTLSTRLDAPGINSALRPSSVPTYAFFPHRPFPNSVRLTAESANGKTLNCDFISRTTLRSP